jgi:ribosomal protein L4
MNEQIPLARLARMYLKMRTRIQELTQEYETQIEEIKAQQHEVKMAMKEQMLSNGQKSARTDNGTVILATKTRYYTQDWSSFKDFIIEHDAVDLLEKRIAQSNMAQFLEQNPGLVPPGLNSDTEYDVTVRRPSK